MALRRKQETTRIRTLRAACRLPGDRGRQSRSASRLAKPKAATDIDLITPPLPDRLVRRRFWGRQPNAQEVRITPRLPERRMRQLPIPRPGAARRHFYA